MLKNTFPRRKQADHVEGKTKNSSYYWFIFQFCFRQQNLSFVYLEVQNKGEERLFLFFARLKEKINRQDSSVTLIVSLMKPWTTGWYWKQRDQVREVTSTQLHWMIDVLFSLLLWLNQISREDSINEPRSWEEKNKLTVKSFDPVLETTPNIILKFLKKMRSRTTREHILLVDSTQRRPLLVAKREKKDKDWWLCNWLRAFAK